MADRLISADALINIIGTIFTDREHGNPHFFNGLATAVEIIENAEEAVVRCKDCKWQTDWDGKLGCGWHGLYETGKNWFCANGERREDGKAD